MRNSYSRFSKDVDICDTTIPNNLRGLLGTILNVLGTVIVIVFAMPIFLVVVKNSRGLWIRFSLGVVRVVGWVMMATFASSEKQTQVESKFNKVNAELVLLKNRVDMLEQNSRKE